MKQMTRIIGTLAFFMAMAMGIVSSPANAVNEVVIGIATSLNTIEGKESGKAAMLAVQAINRKGGVRIMEEWRPIRLTMVDIDDAGPDSEKTESVQKLERFLQKEALHAIAMTPVIESLVLRDPGYRHIFRTGFNTKYLADAMIQIMQFLRARFGFSRVYLLTQDIAWARSTVAIMIRLYFDRMGWQVVGADHFAYGTSDFSASLTRARDRGAQVILPIFDMPHSGNLVIQWQEMTIPAMLCGFISPMVGPGAWEAFDGKIAGTLNVIFELGNMPSDHHPPAGKFYRHYQDHYGQSIQAGHGPAPSYESIYLLADAIESASSLDPEKLVTALEASDRMGPMGRLRFHKGHQIIFGTDPQKEAVVCLFQWTRDGKRRIVYPPSIAEGEIEWPVAGLSAPP
jgi:branched-chain amino acid transport system substrate-binding protein